VLEQVPRYGTIVRRAERSDLVELYELREAVEPFRGGEGSAGSVTGGPDQPAALVR